MKRVGLVGWRGMVGSVLMDRMQAEGDFAQFEQHLQGYAFREAQALLETAARARGIF